MYIQIPMATGTQALYNSYTMAVRNLLIYVYTNPEGRRTKGCGCIYQQVPSISDTYLTHTHLIGRKTTEHSPCLFYTMVYDDRSWF